jgi:hypothetical protein
LLAALANIDSLELLNAYLAQPGLRASLIAEYEKSGVSELNAAAVRPTEREGKLDEARKQLRRVIEDTKLPLTSEQRAALGEIDQIAGDVRQTVTDLRTTVLSAAQSFPVGWNLYPNCAPQSPDTRCAALLVRATPAQREAFRAISACVTAATPLSAQASTGATIPASGTRPASDPLGGCGGRALAYVGWVVDVDPSGLLRWGVGLVLTILLAGLGTPFWIQVVNGFLAARNYIRAGSGAPLQEKPGADTK